LFILFENLFVYLYTLIFLVPFKFLPPLVFDFANSLLLYF